MSAEGEGVPTVLIREPSPEVRELLSHIVQRAGCRPRVWAGGEPAPPGVDLLLLEPAAPGALEGARELRRARPELPIVCVSVLDPTEETRELAPAAYLLKPFRIADLQRALMVAVAAR